MPAERQAPRMKHPSSARDLRRSTALGRLRTFGSVLAPACLHRRGIRPPGCPAPLMSPGLGLWPTPPPLLRCARHPSDLIRQQWLFSTAAGHPCGPPRAWGGRCSEVKAETAATRPSSGDMSVSGLPAPAARTDASTRAAARPSFVNVRNGSLCRALHSDPYAQVTTMCRSESSPHKSSWSDGSEGVATSLHSFRPGGKCLLIPCDNYCTNLIIPV